MASKRINVLVYSGTGSTLESVKHCLYSLRRLLSPNYAVLTVTGEVLLKQPWQPTCALLVLPGGADLGYCATLNGHGNRLIRQYVNNGGSYLGLCAGGYYGSAKCEFEVGGGTMEVIGTRELEFFPGTARGAAFTGFVYNSEAGTRAAAMRVNRTAFKDISRESTLPEVFKVYANGGSVFVDASKFANRGVEVLASYNDQLDIYSGEGAAAVVYRKIGEGSVVLTGPHPDGFAAANLSEKARGADPTVIYALANDDDSRKAFFKACLVKLGLSINENDQDPPSLSRIYFSALNSDISPVLRAWESLAIVRDGEAYIKGEVDTFHIEKPSSTWSMETLAQTISEFIPSLRPGTTRDTNDEEESGIPEPTLAIKRILSYTEVPPDAKETPYFNHSAYYSNLAAYTSHMSHAGSSFPLFGQHLLYGEVVTSTSTLLEKNPSLTNALPTGTTFTATTQLSGRGRGSSVWISPAGSLIFSFLLRHPLKLNATAPLVFLQYLAALAVAEGVQTYDVEDADPISLLSSTLGTTGQKQSAYRAVPVALKWPNDIYALLPSKLPTANAPSSTSPSANHHPNREFYTKIGGILVNTSYAGGDYTAILGIGLNTSNALPTTSLNALIDALNTSRPASRQLKHYTLEKLLARIMTVFGALYAYFCEHGFGGKLEACYERHWLHAGQIIVLEEEGGVTARVKGITRDWGLLRAEEVREVSSRAAAGVAGYGPEGDGYVGVGKEFALQSDSNSFDFFKGFVKRKL